MRSAAIQTLITAVESRFGRVRAYGGGDAEDGHGTAFALGPATFSVHTQEGTLPAGLYDIQIESVPPGQYIFTDVVTLDSFLALVQQVHGPEDDWPRRPTG